MHDLIQDPDVLLFTRVPDPTPPDFVEIPHAALMPHEERPELVLQALVPFLTTDRAQPLRRVH